MHMHAECAAWQAAMAMQACKQARMHRHPHSETHGYAKSIRSGKHTHTHLKTPRMLAYVALKPQIHTGLVLPHAAQNRTHCAVLLPRSEKPLDLPTGSLVKRPAKPASGGRWPGASRTCGHGFCSQVVPHTARQLTQCLSGVFTCAEKHSGAQSRRWSVQ
eukprot:352421-Chlamydomonas_euryale.AAC.7